MFSWVSRRIAFYIFDKRVNDRYELIPKACIVIMVNSVEQDITVNHFLFNRTGQ